MTSRRVEPSGLVRARCLRRRMRPCLVAIELGDARLHSRERGATRYLDARAVKVAHVLLMRCAASTPARPADLPRPHAARFVGTHGCTIDRTPCLTRSARSATHPECMQVIVPSHGSSRTSGVSGTKVDTRSVACLAPRHSWQRQFGLVRGHGTSRASLSRPTTWARVKSSRGYSFAGTDHLPVESAATGKRDTTGSRLLRDDTRRSAECADHAALPSIRRIVEVGVPPVSILICRSVMPRSARSRTC